MIISYSLDYIRAANGSHLHNFRGHLCWEQSSEIFKNEIGKWTFVVLIPLLSTLQYDFKLILV